MVGSFRGEEKMEIVEHWGWKHNVRLTNAEVELLVTADVGPRILRLAFLGGPNLLAEFENELGGQGEKQWKIRGGHRLWIAPEEPSRTYELDNEPVRVEPTPGGVRTIQKPGPLSHVQKEMVITLSRRSNDVRIVHRLTNRGRRSVELAPWALTALRPGGVAVIPLPAKIPHPERLSPNQNWSLWSYTDLGDPRFVIGHRYLLLRQDQRLGPTKLGIAHRQGWVAYLFRGYLFVKRFSWKTGATYPDGGVNFETFSDEACLELETLGPLTRLAPGRSVTHLERWSLFRDVPRCRTEADLEQHLLPLLQ
jgi:hypothetical protein